MKALTKHCRPRMEEECQRIVTDYDLQPKLDAASRLQDIIHQEVENLAFQSARKLPINLPSGVRATRATPMLGFVGGIVGPVAGLLTCEDRVMMDSKIDDLNQAQANLSHLVGTQTHLVRSQLEQLHQTVEEQEGQMYGLKSKLLSTMAHANEIATSVDHIKLTQTITTVLHSVEQRVDQYLRSAHQLIDVVYAARTAKLHTSLLTSQQLELIFRDIQDHSPKTSFPLSGPNISIGPDTRRTYMLLTRSNRALCRDLQNYIMCPGLFPIYETATDPRCELQLLLDPTLAYFKYCNIQVASKLHPYWQAIRSLNGWLYSTTKEIGVEMKCIIKKTINIKINGLGLIRIPLGCELRTNLATLLGLETISGTSLIVYEPSIHLDLTKLSTKFHDNLP